jgi:sugar lactone lactonase YvrE
MPTKHLVSIATYDAPAQGAGGLAWDGTHLWLADFRVKTLLRLDAATLTVQRQLPSQGTPGGLTWDGRLLWQAVFGAGVAVGLDPETGHVQRRAVLPENQGLVRIAGLAWDGTYLWCGSQQDGLLYAVDVPEETVSRSLSLLAPLGGVAWDGQHFWVGGASGLHWNGQSWIDEGQPVYQLLKLDPEEGKALDHYSLAYWPMGLAWDGSWLWVSDSQHSKLHQIAV